MKRTLLMFATLAVVVFPLAGQELRLGEIEFPTSGSPEAQQYFLEGVLLLHSFEYTRAREAFRAAQAREPGFVMAYWGEAMTRNHPVWNRRYRPEALAALAQLAQTPEERLALAPTERERGYLEAVEILFADGAKAERDTAYMEAMENLARSYPDDNEAQVFYALSLLGLNQGVRDFRSYMQAAAIADRVFELNARHPGAAHYLIHSFDDPIHAPLGLPAAWAYSDIAPDAAHAQHMTSHIFLALGVWDAVVARNETAVELTSRAPGHYSAWLNYGYLQQGRYREATDQLVATWANMPDEPNTGMRAYLVTMRAHYLIDSGAWNDQVAGWVIETDDLSRRVRAIDAFTLGLTALKQGKRETAAFYLRQLDAIASPQSDEDDGAVPEILGLLLEGMIALDAQRTDDALLALRKATRLEDGLPLEFGPPDVVKPSHELLGDVLLGLNRPTEAKREYSRALALAPKRANSLLGLYQAAAASGDDKTAETARLELAEIWHLADPTVMESMTITLGSETN